MTETVYYQDPDVRVTSDFVQGKMGIYPLEGIVGIEAKWPLVTLGLVVVGWLCFGVKMLVPSDDPDWVQVLVAGLFVLNSLLLLGLAFMRPVSVRTASGLTRLGVAKFPAARRAIMQAYAEAKSAAAQRRSGRHSRIGGV